MSLRTSYTCNYFSIDDILATQERIPCKFIVNVPKLGKLNPSAEGNDIQAGTSLELPVWLVLPIAAGRHPVIATNLPKIFKESYREILKADACAVNLPKLNMYFYEFGSYARLFDGRGDTADILINTFRNRFRQLMDLADNTSSDPTVQDQLDNLEKRIFNESHTARIKLNAWLIESGAPMEAATMVVNHKKRKRVHIEDIT